MKRLDIALIFALVAGLAAWAVPNGTALALPQEEAAPGETDLAEVADTGEADEFDGVEEILQQEEEMIQGAFSYDAGRRRDPFISLIRKREVTPVGTLTGECPTGCLIDEITLTGIFMMPEGPVAQIQSPDQEKSFLIRVGDEFHDGDVIAITADGIQFRQMVSDFQEMKPFREVTKKLNP